LGQLCRPVFVVDSVFHEALAHGIRELLHLQLGLRQQTLGELGQVCSLPVEGDCLVQR